MDTLRDGSDPGLLQRILRRLFLPLEALFDRAFGPAWNPFYHLGSLGFFYYWVVAASGIYLYIFFDTGLTEAYDSVQDLTHGQWYLGGIMRSLHRYASDGMVLMMVLHIVREFSLGRYRGPRWFTWVTGTPIVWLVLACGITGYWLVWDELAQYVAVTSAEWLDWLPVFNGAIVRNFLSPEALDDRFFTLLAFLHIAIPLLLLFVLWIHLQRVSQARFLPARGLGIGTFAMLVGLSLVQPALSHDPANLSQVPGRLDLDWYYLFAYPLVDAWSAGPVWLFSFLGTLFLVLIPWLPLRKQPPAAVVDLANCNGCGRCEADCPYTAIQMVPRSDGGPFEQEALVRDDLCVGCGICAGSCPTSTPFRRASALVPGIDLPDLPLAGVRSEIDSCVAKLQGNARVVVFGCEHGVATDGFEGDDVATVKVPCVAALPPSFIDYVLSRDRADGVFLTGCAEGNCFYRQGIDWTEQRIAGTRDPHLRARVPRARLATGWYGVGGKTRLKASLKEFQDGLQAMPKAENPGGGSSADPAAELQEI